MGAEQLRLDVKTLPSYQENIDSALLPPTPLEVYAPLLEGASLLERHEHDMSKEYGELRTAELVDPSSVSFHHTYVHDGEQSGTIFKMRRGPDVVAIDIVLERDGEEVRYELPTPLTDTSVVVGYIPDLSPGEQYGVRVWGPGNQIDHRRVVVDPYALAVNGDVSYDDDGKLVLPRAVVVDRSYDWEGLDKPAIQRKDGERVIQECHVSASTKLNPEIEPDIRGTYAALGSTAHKRDLIEQGINVEELMPVQHHVKNERFFGERRKLPEVEGRNLENAWGYNTLVFNAPHSQYSSDTTPGAQVKEFKDMVKSLHEDGIEVVLDVVYNHTSETGDSADNMSFSGLGWDIYRRLGNNSTTNYSGCGPDTDTTKPDFAEYVLDSLEYWVVEMGVDGFRFDLAATLAREGYDGKAVRPNGEFMRKLSEKVAELEEKTGKNIFIAFEAWDMGYCDPQAFSDRGHSWSQLFRDTARKFMRGEASAEDVATMVVGSLTQHKRSDKLPVHFVNAHDGFTWEDVVSYLHKHNEVNGENNGDGTDENFSANFGWEGPTEDPNILAERERAKRALFSLLAVSRAVLMWVYGDERSRTQGGINNAYCQTELIRTDWGPLDARKQQAREFRDGVMRFRQSTATLQRTARLTETPALLGHDPDLSWISGDGNSMSVDDWKHHRILGMYRSGIAHPDSGEADGDTTLVYFNMGENNQVRIPNTWPYKGIFEQVFNSHTGSVQDNPSIDFVAETVNGADGTITVLKAQRETLESGQELEIGRTSVIGLRRIASTLKNANTAAASHIRLGMHISEILDIGRRKNVAA